MAYPQITDYQEAVQHPAHAFIDPDLKQGAVAENNLGLPLVMSGGFALTYAVTTPKRKCAVRCFHREIPAIQQKYDATSKKLRSLAIGCFVDFDFQQSGITVRQKVFPIVRMDWVEGDTLGVWLDKNFNNPRAIDKARGDFVAIARFLEREGIAHGDIQNGNVMVANGEIKLIDYDGMFVPGMKPGNGSETGHRHFQHPGRRVSSFGPGMDRFSFIALDLSLRALVADKSLYPKFREGGETIIFKANDFADPQNSEIFRRLLAMPKLKEQARGFAAICVAPLEAVPTLDEFLAGKNIPAAKAPISATLTPATKPATAYIPAYPVVDALNFSAALQRVGDRIELIGRIVEIKPGSRKQGKGPSKRYVFINFGSWRGNIIKISIWSDGLARLKDKPSAAWIGRWVSITGLMDVHETKSYRHLSITVQEEGQIQWLDDAQAGFRLASIAMPSRDRILTGAAFSGSPVTASLAAAASPAAASPVAAAKPKTPRPRRQGTARGHKRAGPQQPIPAATIAITAQQGTQSPRRFVAASPLWMWMTGTIIVLITLLLMYARLRY
jgi:hypothetical protein